MYGGGGGCGREVSHELRGCRRFVELARYWDWGWLVGGDAYDPGDVREGRLGDVVAGSGP